MADKAKTYKITDDCISCGACMGECPVNDESNNVFCIKEGEPYEIDPELCIGCKACANICPVDACVPAE